MGKRVQGDERLGMLSYGISLDLERAPQLEAFTSFAKASRIDIQNTQRKVSNINRMRRSSEKHPQPAELQQNIEGRAGRFQPPNRTTHFGNHENTSMAVGGGEASHGALTSKPTQAPNSAHELLGTRNTSLWKAWD